MGMFQRKKCCHCKVLFRPDVRNAGRQRYCRKSECRKASKTASQRRWLQKPENRDYFRGSENVERVQQWRKAHPGYWRRKARPAENALQDLLNPQHGENNSDSLKFEKDALQDLLIKQPFVLIGLISNFTGSALQDDIVNTVRRMQQLGLDIVNHTPQIKGGQHDEKGSYSCRSYPKGPQPLQLGRSSAGP
jgi:hypothetical protein